MATRQLLSVSGKLDCIGRIAWQKYQNPNTSLPQEKSSYPIVSKKPKPGERGREGGIKTDPRISVAHSSMRKTYTSVF